MKQRNGIIAVTTLFAALALWTTACEDTELTAPNDGTILLTVNPSTIFIDEGAGETEGSATVVARVFDLNGQALQNVGVIFTSSAGSLQSGGSAGQVNSVKTDSSGIATDVITLQLNDPDLVDVVAQSSALSSTVQLSKTTIAPNQPPLAAILPTPPQAIDPLEPDQVVGKPVIFDGSISIDPDGDPITCYKWRVESTVAASNEDFQGPGDSGFDRTYNAEQELVVSLWVTDDPAVGALCNPAGPLIPDQSFPGSGFTQIPYTIGCANEAPVAEAGPNQNVPITNPQILLDGSQSLDTEQIGIERYQWTCGNGTQGQIINPAQPWLQLCRYTAAGDYQAQLTVWDKGDGSITPGNGNFGNWDCQRQASDLTTVTVFVP